MAHILAENQTHSKDRPMTAMAHALKQLKIIWDIQRLLEAKQQRTEAERDWLNKYYEDEARSDRNAGVE